MRGHGGWVLRRIQMINWFHLLSIRGQFVSQSPAQESWFLCPLKPHLAGKRGNLLHQYQDLLMLIWCQSHPAEIPELPPSQHYPKNATWRTGSWDPGRKTCKSSRICFYVFAKYPILFNILTRKNQPYSSGLWWRSKTSFWAMSKASLSIVLISTPKLYACFHRKKT